MTISAIAGAVASSYNYNPWGDNDHRNDHRSEFLWEKLGWKKLDTYEYKKETYYTWTIEKRGSIWELRCQQLSNILEKFDSLNEALEYFEEQ